MNTESLKQKLLSGSLWVFVGKFVTGIAQIFIAMILARILSLEDFGSFQVIQRVLLFLSIIGSFGMGWVMVRRVAEGLALEQPSKSFIYAKNIFLIVIVITTFLSLIFFIFGSQIISNIFNIDINGLFLVMIGLLFCFSLQQIIPEGFRGLHDLKYASIFSGAATNTTILVLLLILFFGMQYVSSLSDILYVYFISALAIIGISSQLLYRRFLKMKKNIIHNDNNHELKEILKTGFPLTLSNLLNFFVSQADVWIVAALFSVKAAAYYAAASLLVFVVTAPLMIANGVTRGIITDLWARDAKKKLQKFIRRIANFTMLVSLVPGMIFLLWGDDVMLILYGGLYQEAAGVLTFLVLGQLILLTTGQAATLMILAGHQKQLLYIDTVSVFLFCVFVYILKSSFGIEGIAAASASSISIKAQLSGYYAQRKLNICTYVGNSSVSRVGYLK